MVWLHGAAHLPPYSGLDGERQRGWASQESLQFRHWNLPETCPGEAAWHGSLAFVPISTTGLASSFWLVF